MFYYFFEDYKEKIYKGSRGRLNWFERIMFIWLIFSFLFFAFSLVLNFHILIKIIAIALLLIVLILIWI